MRDLDRLEAGQIDLMLKLGGSNAEMFLQILLRNSFGHERLRENVKYLIQKMNLAFCCEMNEELYLEVFGTVSNIPEIPLNDMRFAFDMTFQVTRLVTRRREFRKAKTTLVYSKKQHIAVLTICETLKDIIKAVTEDCIKSVFEVVDILLWSFYMNTPNREDTQIFLENLENLCSDKKLQKVSKQYLDMIIASLSYSSLEQSDQMMNMLKKIKNNDKLSTYHENVIIASDKTITREGADYDELYTFKHPATGTCSESGSLCGFILRRKIDGDRTIELCTSSEDYKNTGIHSHDNISAHEMCWYGTMSGKTGAGNKLTVAVVGLTSWFKKWFPNVVHWKEDTSHVAYNITNYHVATNE